MLFQFIRFGELNIGELFKGHWKKTGKAPVRLKTIQVMEWIFKTKPAHLCNLGHVPASKCFFCL